MLLSKVARYYSIHWSHCLECTNVSSIYILLTASVIVFTAAVGGNKDCAAQLIRKGARVNDTDKDGKTALMIAVVNGHLGLVDLLLDNSADISLKSAVSSSFTETLHFPNNQIDCIDSY